MSPSLSLPFIYSLSPRNLGIFLIYHDSQFILHFFQRHFTFPFPFLYHLLIPRERNLGIYIFFFFSHNFARQKSSRTILVRFLFVSIEIEKRGNYLKSPTRLYYHAEMNEGRSNIEINTMHSRLATHCNNSFTMAKMRSSSRHERKKLICKRDKIILQRDRYNSGDSC